MWLSWNSKTVSSVLALLSVWAASESIFAKTKPLKGLVIDVRSNGGGEDALVEFGISTG